MPRQWQISGDEMISKRVTILKEPSPDDGNFLKEYSECVGEFEYVSDGSHVLVPYDDYEKISKLYKVTVAYNALWKMNKKNG